MEHTEADASVLRPPPFRRRLRRWDPLLIVLGVLALAALGFMLWTLGTDTTQEAAYRPPPPPVAAAPAETGEIERSLSHEILIRERDQRTTDDETAEARSAAAPPKAKARQPVADDVLADWRSSIERMRHAEGVPADAAPADRGPGEPSPALPADADG